jgi:hypothetical protein
MAGNLESFESFLIGSKATLLVKSRRKPHAPFHPSFTISFQKFIFRHDARVQVVKQAHENSASLYRKKYENSTSCSFGDF